jgi:hydrogenase expression/formation protein HypD
MKYITEYRDKEKVKILAEKIKLNSSKEITLMEVCGGHTMSIHKFGIPSLLPENIKLISGPGCPVCVTEQSYIDKVIEIAKNKDVIITTFGDLIRVPGTKSSLEKEKSLGADIRIVYSAMEAIKIATQNKNKKIIFLGIGFETTAPATAASIIEAYNERIDNYYVFSAHKIMPPVMVALIDEGVKINGYLCPGHVSTITGSAIYNDLAYKYKLAVVVSGFEPVDILQSIYMLVKQIENSNPKVEIQYSRAVKPEGNIKALKIMNEVFETRDDYWRGLGIIKQSGLAIKEKYSEHDAEKKFNIKIGSVTENCACICGAILKGIKNPSDCKLFSKACTPENPVGACMVSHEGACNAWYRFKNITK